MTRTVLFFGDSNTRGYGVGRARRFATLIEAALAPEMGSTWRFAASGATSDFKVIPERLDAAIAKHRPDILVWQCPTGPAAYFVQYPAWLRPLRAVYNAFFKWQRQLRIRWDIARGGGAARRPRSEALSEGLYVEALYRWRPASWPIARHVNGILAQRYGTFVKATRERYLALMERHRDRLRASTDADMLFLGLVPHSDFFYPGYCERVLAWGKDLEALLHRPALGCFYVELCAPLLQDGGVRRHLLRDGAHLSAAGHRRVAELVVPALASLMHARGR